MLTILGLFLVFLRLAMLIPTLMYGIATRLQGSVAIANTAVYQLTARYHPHALKRLHSRSGSQARSFYKKKKILRKKFLGT